MEEKTGRKIDFMLTGPAQHRAGGWQLPVKGGEATVKDTLTLQEEERDTAMVLPRSWPGGSR